MTYQTLRGWAAGILGTTLVHEVGHYLGLLHVFDSESTCPSGTEDCYETQDLICDTADTELAVPVDCNDVISCNEVAAIQNYMFPGIESPCLDNFTTEQVARMRCSLLTYRPELPLMRRISWLRTPLLTRASYSRT